MAKKKEAPFVYADYIQLIQETFGDVRRDIFTGDLFCFDKIKNRWVPILGTETFGELRSIFRDKGDRFTVAAIEDHLLRFQKYTKPKLLIDIPDWDGEDRIEVISRCLHCKNLSCHQVDEILKDWGAKMWRRLYDPIMQNRIIIFLSSEGAGKDHLIEQMLGGLGQYLVPFTVQQQEKDTFDLVCSGLVMNISEYDRTNSYQNTGTLKSIITGKRLKFRGAYERKSEFRTDRASFIASCNPNAMGILRESGKNRRYVILEVEKLDWDYPQGDSMQILAQWRYLSSKGFKTSEETETAIRAYIESQTPTDEEQEIVDHYRSIYPTDMLVPDKDYLLSSGLDNVWSQLHKTSGLRIPMIRNILKRRGYGKHARDGTRYYQNIDENQKPESCHTPVTNGDTVTVEHDLMTDAAVTENPNHFEQLSIHNTKVTDVTDDIEVREWDKGRNI